MLILMIGEFNDSITLQYFPNIVLLFMYYIWHKSVPSCWIVRKFINHFPAYLFDRVVHCIVFYVKKKLKFSFKPYVGKNLMEITTLTAHCKTQTFS